MFVCVLTLKVVFCTVELDRKRGIVVFQTMFMHLKVFQFTYLLSHMPFLSIRLSFIYLIVHLYFLFTCLYLHLPIYLFLFLHVLQLKWRGGCVLISKFCKTLSLSLSLYFLGASTQGLTEVALTYIRILI